MTDSILENYNEEVQIVGNFIKIFVDKLFEDEMEFAICLRSKDAKQVHYFSTMDRADAIKLMRKTASVVEESL